MKNWQEKRCEAFDRYMAGESSKTICESLGVSRSWLFKWVKRGRENNGDFTSLPRTPRNPRRTTCPFLYGCTLRVRAELEESQFLSIGAPYIVWELKKIGCTSRLSISTIERHLRTAKVTLKKQPRRKKVPEELKATALCHNDCQQADLVGP
jgi:transposase